MYNSEQDNPKSRKQLWQLVFSVVFILILSNFSLKTIFPSLVINALSIVFIALIQFYYGFKNGIVFFIAQLLVLSNFTYGNNQGGLYNITTFIALVLLFSSSQNWRLTEKTSNFRWIILLGFINVLGYLFHQVEIAGIIQGFITFTSFLLIYLIISENEFQLSDISFIFKGLMIVQVFSLAINLLKLFDVYNSSLPMFGGESRIGSMTQAGVMGNSELFSELNVIILIFITAVILSKELKGRFLFSNFELFFFLYVSLANVILTRSKSGIILYVIALVYMLLKSKLFSLYQGDLRGLLILIVSVLSFFVFFGPIVNTKFSFTEFEILTDFRFNEDQIIKGYGLNRNNVFLMALDKLNERPWVIGYGWGNTERNRIAWGITNRPEIADFHNLYYSLPMIFGWIGFFIIVFLMLKTTLRLLQFKDNGLMYENVILRQVIFLLIMIVILIDQFKISAMRDPNYFMMFWIFLGLANSITSKHLQNEEMQ